MSGGDAARGPVQGARGALKSFKRVSREQALWWYAKVFQRGQLRMDSEFGRSVQVKCVCGSRRRFNFSPFFHAVFEHFFPCNFFHRTQLAVSSQASPSHRRHSHSTPRDRIRRSCTHMYDRQPEPKRGRRESAKKPKAGFFTAKIITQSVSVVQHITFEFSK